LRKSRLKQERRRCKEGEGEQEGEEGNNLSAKKKPRREVKYKKGRNERATRESGRQEEMQ